MTLIPSRLPSGGAAKPPAPAAGPGPGHDQAWQHAMEKAQASQWFHGAAPAVAGVAASMRAYDPTAVGLPLPRPVQQHEPDGPQVRRAVHAGPALTRDAVPSASPNPVRTMPHPVRQAPAEMAASAAARRAGAADAGEPCRVAPAARGAAGLADRALFQVPPDVHLHVEETPAGLRVWLGLAGDAAAVAARADALVAGLRRQCRDSGQRLDCVVCNGATLFDAGTGPASAFVKANQET